MVIVSRKLIEAETHTLAEWHVHVHFVAYAFMGRTHILISFNLTLFNVVQSFLLFYLLYFRVMDLFSCFVCLFVFVLIYFPSLKRGVYNALEKEKYDFFENHTEKGEV